LCPNFCYLQFCCHFPWAYLVVNKPRTCFQ
jgi:hypothetical protein